MKHSIIPSLFTYNSRLIGEGGFSLRVAYKLNNFFQIQIRSFTYKLRGFLPGTYGMPCAWFDMTTKENSEVTFEPFGYNAG